MNKKIKIVLYTGLIILIVLKLGLYGWNYFQTIVDGPEPSEQAIPYYQKIILLVKYNDSICPNLAVNHTRDNQSWIKSIKHVANISQEINFVELGRYNTNVPTFRIQFEFVNTGNCTPDFLILTSNEFITLLIDYGVSVETPNVTTTEENLTKDFYNRIALKEYVGTNAL